MELTSSQKRVWERGMICPVRERGRIIIIIMMMVVVMCWMTIMV
jgi:hypothetical protein